MNISERGTNFDERVEIDQQKRTVVYKVPAHNNLDESEVFFDFEAV